MNEKIDILAKRLRLVFGLPEVCSNKEVLSITKGTLTRSFVELSLAQQELRRVTAELIDEKLKFIRQRHE